MTNNQIQYWNLKETERANKARELEQHRANSINLEIQSRANEIKDRANQINWQIGSANLSELNRHQTTVEEEAARNNRVNNQLEAWKQAISEKKVNVDEYAAQTGRLNVGLGYATLGETTRSHQVNEEISRQNLEEQHRHSIESENIDRFKAATQYGTGKQNADVNQQNAVTRGQELLETTRSHKQNEFITQENNLRNQQLRSLELYHQIQNDANRTQQNYVNNINSSLSSILSAKIRAQGGR